MTRRPFLRRFGPAATASFLTGALLSAPSTVVAQTAAFPEPPAFPNLPPAPPVATRPTDPHQPASSKPETRYEPQAQTQTKPLRVEVIDGASFRDIEGGTVYRLWGIDVCRADQSALLGRQPWPCGTMARAWLVNATLGKWVSCNVIEAGEGVSAARCSSSSYPDIALAMLKEGMAVALPQERQPKQIKIYPAAQEMARKAFRGLWGSAFDMPWTVREQVRAPTASAPPDLPANPTESPSPIGVSGDLPIQNEGAPLKSLGLTHVEQKEERK